MTDSDNLDVHQREFEEWLRTEPEHAVVGEARGALTDPLAHFLRERFRQAALLGREKVRLGKKVWFLPEWAQEYLRLADASVSFAPITAKEALDLLARVGPERLSEPASIGPPPEFA